MSGPAIRFRTLLAAALIAVATAAPARAQLSVWVEAPSVADPDSSETNADGVLVATFGLHDLLDPDDTTLGEGIPATLTLVVDLWRGRSGWWDNLVHSQVYTYRFRRDVWSGSYEVVGPDRTVMTLEDTAALRAFFERGYEIPLGAPGRYEAGKSYHLTVKAVLQPLDLDDLEEMEAWLSGDVTEGSGGGGLLGVPRALVRAAVSLSGLGDRTAVGRSEAFVPRPER